MRSISQRVETPQQRADRFWALVNRDGDCWLWTGEITKAGYGRFNVIAHGATTLAHRFAYEQLHGPLGTARLTHVCNNNACVRPDHLAVTKPRGRRPQDVAERFWAKVDKTGECWLWLSTCYPNGRGQFKLNGKTVKAYHVAYQLTIGPIPPGLLVCHDCDNPRCVRPDHLFLGTNADNMRDMKLKGRSTAGARNPQYKHGQYVGQSEGRTHKRKPKVA